MDETYTITINSYQNNNGVIVKIDLVAKIYFLKAIFK